MLVLLGKDHQVEQPNAKALRENFERAHGGHRQSPLEVRKVTGKGWLTFAYAADFEGNIIELQTWG